MLHLVADGGQLLLGVGLAAWSVLGPARCDCGSGAGADDAADSDRETHGDVAPADGTDATEYTGTDGAAEPDVVVGSRCGDGVLNDGEECDDGNRLDGDGCSWLCRLGDGDPPPAPDPAVDPFGPVGPPAPLEGAAPTMPPNAYHRLPLAWTGTEFATAVSEQLPDYLWQIRFRRFDEGGRSIDADWVYPSPAMTELDLVWTGAGFGLFYSDLAAGIFFLGLDPDGKPRGAPLLVVPDPQARAPAADLATDGFVLVWMTEGMPGPITTWCGARGEPPDDVRVRLLGAAGETEDRPGPFVVETRAGWPPDVAHGADGFGLVLARDVTVEDPDCRFRFLRLSEDLGTMTVAGDLGPGSIGEVAWAGDHWATGWARQEDFEAEGPWCVGRFLPSGVLERAPVCTTTPSGLVVGAVAVRLAVGGGGLALAGLLGAYPRFLRTDAAGAAVGPFEAVGSPDVPTWSSCAVAWGADAFGILHVRGGIPSSVLLQMFTAR